MRLVYIFNVAIIVGLLPFLLENVPHCTGIKIAIKYWERNLRILLTKEVKWEMVV